MCETEHKADASQSEEAPEKTKKTPKRGIIYLSSIPPYMNVSKIREVFGEFGEIGRVYLQLANTEPKPGEKKSKRKKPANKFTEGWVEFARKSTAKKVALHLNNAQVSQRKKSKHYDVVWNIKYLPGFKWTHLHERLAYEKAARRHKLRTEIDLAKRKADFFKRNVGKKTPHVNKEYVDIEKSDVEKQSVPEARDDFLQTLFN